MDSQHGNNIPDKTSTFFRGNINKKLNLQIIESISIFKKNIFSSIRNVR